MNQDETAQAQYRKQAHTWLRAELSSWEKVALTIEAGNHEAVAKAITPWKENANLASVREKTELAKLPEEERKEWQAMWASVDALLAKVGPK